MRATPVPRILVVDDQAHVRAAIVVALRANAFDAVGAEDAVAALHAFETDHFDLAVVDIYMPSTDGVRLIKALRERSPRLPIIAISGVRLNATHTTALAFLPKLPGMAEIVCLQKPFRTGELARAIRAALAVAA
jgi:DNA-binding response OmpR family regulator